MLKPQVNVVLEGMRNAVQAEEERLLRVELEEEKIAREKTIERLKQINLCPMGYSWHPCGNGDGWRCAGGGHFISNAELQE
jgi:hypothetical protein